jgi:hypothetical protein
LTGLGHAERLGDFGNSGNCDGRNPAFTCPHRRARDPLLGARCTFCPMWWIPARDFTVAP